MPGSSALDRRATWLAWAGGTLFVVSLTGCFVTFLWGMGGDPPPGAHALTSAVINAGLFTIFAGHHSLLARTGAKRWITTHLPPRLERSLYVWVASLLLIGVWLGWQELPGALYHHTGAAALVHWVVVLAGFGLTSAAARLIDPLELAGIRQATGSAAPPEFKVTGTYHLVRHPIYLGWLLIVFGVPVMTWTRLEFSVVSSLYLILAIPFEERSLVETFGDTYRDYQRRVKWRIVPGIW